MQDGLHLHPALLRILWQFVGSIISVMTLDPILLKERMVKSQELDQHSFSLQSKKVSNLALMEEFISFLHAALVYFIISWALYPIARSIRNVLKRLQSGGSRSMEEQCIFLKRLCVCGKRKSKRILSITHFEVEIVFLRIPHTHILDPVWSDGGIFVLLCGRSP